MCLCRWVLAFGKPAGGNQNQTQTWKTEPIHPEKFDGEWRTDLQLAGHHFPWKAPDKEAQCTYFARIVPGVKHTPWRCLVIIPLTNQDLKWLLKTVSLASFGWGARSHRKQKDVPMSFVLYRKWKQLGACHLNSQGPAGSWTGWEPVTELMEMNSWNWDVIVTD